MAKWQQKQRKTKGNVVRAKQMNKRGEMFRMTPLKVFTRQRHITTLYAQIRWGSWQHFPKWKGLKDQSIS